MPTKIIMQRLSQCVLFCSLLWGIACLAKTVQLNVDNHPFAARFYPAETNKPCGGIVLVSDQHLDSPHVIKPLALKLPHYGCATLTVLLPRDMPPPQQIKLLQAATAYLTQQNITPVFLLGYHQTADSLVRFISQATPGKVRKLVLISGELTAAQQTHFKQLALPILEVFASFDYRSVLRQQLQRAQIAKAAHQPYHRYEIIGADGYYTAMEDVLSLRIGRFLSSALD